MVKMVKGQNFRPLLILYIWHSHLSPSHNIYFLGICHDIRHTKQQLAGPTPPSPMVISCSQMSWSRMSNCSVKMRYRKSVHEVGFSTSVREGKTRQWQEGIRATSEEMQCKLIDMNIDLSLVYTMTLNCHKEKFRKNTARMAGGSMSVLRTHCNILSEYKNWRGDLPAARPPETSRSRDSAFIIIACQGDE